MTQPPSDTDPGSAEAVVLAVPDDAIDELVAAGLVDEMPTLRGPILDAIVTVGVDSAALVTLLQTPDTVRAFAAWIVGRVQQRKDTIRVSGRQDGRHIDLKVTGDVSIEAVANFLQAAFEASPPGPASH